MFKRLFQLKAATSHVLQVFAQKSNFSCRVNSRAGFFYFLPSDQNLAGQDQSLRSLARTCESAFQK